MENTIKLWKIDNFRRKPCGKHAAHNANVLCMLQRFLKQHPSILYAGILLIVSVVIFASANSWADHRAKKIVDEWITQYQADELARKEAEQAALAAVKESEAERREREIILIAQLLDGIKGFVEKYHYTADDLMTYALCPINRVLSPAFSCTTIEEALMQDGQWVGFSLKNQVTIENYNIARRVVDDFYDSQVRIVGCEYTWAEFTEDGLYLTKVFGSHRYSDIWRYNGSNG